MKGFEAHHWGGNLLNEAVVLLEEVVELFHLPDLDCVAPTGEFQHCIHSLQVTQIGTALVDDHSVPHAICGDAAAQEPACNGQVPML